MNIKCQLSEKRTTLTHNSALIVQKSNYYLIQLLFIFIVFLNGFPTSGALKK